MNLADNEQEYVYRMWVGVLSLQEIEKYLIIIRKENH